MEDPHQHDASGHRPHDGEGSAEDLAEDTTEVRVGRGQTGSGPPEARDQAGGSGAPDLHELRTRIGIKDNHIRELYEQIAVSRLAADEARAAREAGEEHIEALREERARLKDRIRTLEEELRQRRRRREGLERQVGRLERELERKEHEITRRDELLERRTEEMEAMSLEAEAMVARKERALQDALRRVAGLERDLEEREGEAGELRARIEALHSELEAEYGLRERLAEPANRLRAGIDLFNDSEHRRTMNSLSRTLGQPEVHVELASGEEPPVLLTFTWQGVTWQTYAANPGLAVDPPRVYRTSAGEDLSGVDRRPPNARVGPGGRVLLGL